MFLTYSGTVFSSKKQYLYYIFFLASSQCGKYRIFPQTNIFLLFSPNLCYTWINLPGGASVSGQRFDFAAVYL
jgi:hypothetical protein